MTYKQAFIATQQAVMITYHELKAKENPTSENKAQITILPNVLSFMETREIDE